MAGAPRGTLVTAGVQSAGRGRQGRRWSAPAGSSILMSLAAPRPAAAASADRSSRRVRRAGERAGIKWPNDVVVAGGAGEAPAKLAGILVEGRPRTGGPCSGSA